MRQSRTQPQPLALFGVDAVLATAARFSPSPFVPLFSFISSADNAWTSVAFTGDALPRLCQHTLIAHKNNAYIFGGTNADAANCNHLYRLTLQEEAASAKPRRASREAKGEHTTGAASASPAVPTRPSKTATKKPAPQASAAPKKPPPAKPPAPSRSGSVRKSSAPQPAAKPARSRPGSIVRKEEPETKAISKDEVGRGQASAPSPPPTISIGADALSLPPLQTPATGAAEPIHVSGRDSLEAQRSALVQVRGWDKCIPLAWVPCVGLVNPDACPSRLFPLINDRPSTMPLRSWRRSIGSST